MATTPATTSEGVALAAPAASATRAAVVPVGPYELEARGIVVRCPTNAALAEEAPVAYKDVERVAEVVERAALARRVTRLRPLGVVQG